MAIGLISTFVGLEGFAAVFALLAPPFAPAVATFPDTLLDDGIALALAAPTAFFATLP